MGSCESGRSTSNMIGYVQFILNNRRRLRKSTISLTRNQIYINPDLTKAEASAAFEMRQRRRAARARSNQRNQHSSSRVFNLDAMPFEPSRGHIKNIHPHSCKHKTVTLKLTLTLTLTVTDTGGAVLTLMLGYRRLRIYKLKRKIKKEIAKNI